jgi:hypothetical protein
MIAKADSMEGAIGVNMTSDWIRMESNENDVADIDGDNLQLDIVPREIGGFFDL